MTPGTIFCSPATFGVPSCWSLGWDAPRRLIYGLSTTASCKVESKCFPGLRFSAVLDLQIPKRQQALATLLPAHVWGKKKKKYISSTGGSVMPSPCPGATQSHQQPRTTPRNTPYLRVTMVTQKFGKQWLTRREDTSHCPQPRREQGHLLLQIPLCCQTRTSIPSRSPQKHVGFYETGAEVDLEGITPRKGCAGSPQGLTLSNGDLTETRGTAQTPQPQAGPSLPPSITRTLNHHEPQNSSAPSPEGQTHVGGL